MSFPEEDEGADRGIHPFNTKLLSQRAFAGILGQPASVLNASLLVVSGDAFSKPWFDHRLFDDILAGDLHAAIILHARSSRDQPAHDDVLLETAQVVHLAVDGGFGEDTRCL